MTEDDRFTCVLKDPRFKKIPKEDRKVKIDLRFSRMFTDKNFHTKYTVDKRGKPLQATSNEDLEKFYEIEKSDEAVKDKPSTKCKIKKSNNNIQFKTCNSQDKLESESENVNISSEIDVKENINSEDEDANKQPALAEVSSSSDDGDDEDGNFNDIRGRIVASDSDDESGEDDVGVVLEEGLVHGWGELDEDALRIENAETTRLAFCNCDWEKITATDLFVLCNSFLPTGGSIISVKVYPSDFGLEKMQKEDVDGPLDLKSDDKISGETADSGAGEGEGQAYHMEKLREYQLNRLKYYYAVIECDSKVTADKIYEECDGMEYELSATRLDIRFIPDETSFNHEPRDVANEMPSVANYQPTAFFNTALQQSTVRLTWDEPDVKRIQTTGKHLSQKDIDNMDFKDYVASSSEDDDENDTSQSVTNNNDKKITRINKYKALVEMLNEKAKEEQDDADEDEMEVTWKPGQTLTSGHIAKKKTNMNASNTGKNATHDIEPDNLDEESDDMVLSPNEKDDDAETGFDDPFFNDVNPNGDATKKNKKKKNYKNDDNMDDGDLTEEQHKSKAALSLLLMNEEESEKTHFNMPLIEKAEKLDKKKKKRKIKKKVTEQLGNDEFNVNVSDERFSAIYDSHLYALDPSEPHFKRTKATEAILSEAQKRRELKVHEKSEEIDKLESKLVKDVRGINPSLSSLVKSVKGKTQNHVSAKKKIKHN